MDRIDRVTRRVTRNPILSETAEQNQMTSDLLPMDPAALSWIEYWYPVAWKGLLAGALITVIAGITAIGFRIAVVAHKPSLEDPANSAASKVVTHSSVSSPAKRVSSFAPKAGLMSWRNSGLRVRNGLGEKVLAGPVDEASQQLSPRILSRHGTAPELLCAV
jgi:hypothetical protein